MVNIETLMVESAPTYESGAKYLKTKFRSNKDRFLSRWLEPNSVHLQMEGVENHVDITKFYLSLWDEVEPFSYSEAFSIEQSDFRGEVFSVINVPEMIKELGTDRIKTEGIELTNKVFNTYTKTFEEKNFTQIYELHKVKSKKLGLTDDVYAVKCWCTSTEEEHWLWIDKSMGETNDPLKAIASTCKVYKSMLGNIKHIIRQGDVFLFEMIGDNIKPSMTEEIVSLDVDTYFRLLKSQS